MSYNFEKKTLFEGKYNVSCLSGEFSNDEEPVFESKATIAAFYENGWFFGIILAIPTEREKPVNEWHLCNPFY